MDEWPSKVTISVVIDTLLYHNWLYIVHIPVVFSIILFQVNVFNHSYKLCTILNLCWWNYLLSKKWILYTNTGAINAKSSALSDWFLRNLKNSILSDWFLRNQKNYFIWLIPQKSKELLYLTDSSEIKRTVLYLTDSSEYHRTVLYLTDSTEIKRIVLYLTDSSEIKRTVLYLRTVIIIMTFFSTLPRSVKLECCTSGQKNVRLEYQRLSMTVKLYTEP